MMTTRTMSLRTHEIGFLRETLNGQQELLQKLYNELDEERESSATAADETLSVMLRLQGEKSALEMEANQYKRIAEEKMCHAQETVETFQELIYQKEMQIASLEFQIQAYKFKLSSLGIDDVASCDLQYPENMLLRKNGLVGEISSQSSPKTFQRGYSLPPRVSNGWSRRVSTEGTMTIASSPKTVQENPYLEDIKMLDERVKGFISSIHDPSPDNSSDKLEFPENSKKMLNVQNGGESICLSSVHDIFEVPQVSDKHQGGVCENKVKPESRLEKGTGNIKWDCEIVDGKKKPLISPVSDRISPNNMEEKLDCEKTPLLSPNLNEYAKNEKQKLFKLPTFDVSDFELKQFNRRLRQLEDERLLARVPEISDETGGAGLKLLREIIEKVEAVQSEITSLKTQMPSPPENRSFGCFKEVIQYFLP